MYDDFYDINPFDMSDDCFDMGDEVNSDLVIPDSFAQCLSYEQQVMYLYKLFTDYEKGVSPEVTITDIEGGHRITITDADHPDGQSFDVMDGEPGQDGSDGQDGVSPTVTITQITNGHRVTITDAEHPQGQSFDVMNGEKGDKGDKGDRGETGEAGFSPEVTITQITGGHRISITDADGTQTFDVMDGQDGQAIPPVITAQATVGSGTGTPTVTVTKSGTDEAPTYTFAFDNLKGANGADGVSPTITVTDHSNYHHIEITSAGGTEQFDVYDGTDGSDGTDGVSPTVTVRSITGGHQIEIVSAGGTEQFDVMDGTDGSDGSDGQDGAAATIQVGTVTTGAAGTNASVNNSGTSSAAVFDFTIPRGADGQTGATGPAGPGVASGGTAGQILAKASGTDYDTEWINPPSGDDLTYVAKFVQYGTNIFRLYKDSSGRPIFKMNVAGAEMVDASGGGYGLTISELWTYILSAFEITSSEMSGYAVYDANDNFINYEFSDLLNFLTSEFGNFGKTSFTYGVYQYSSASTKFKTLTFAATIADIFLTQAGPTISGGTSLQIFQQFI